MLTSTIYVLWTECVPSVAVFGHEASEEIMKANEVVRAGPGANRVVPFEEEAAGSSGCPSAGTAERPCKDSAKAAIRKP